MQRYVMRLLVVGLTLIGGLTLLGALAAPAAVAQSTAPRGTDALTLTVLGTYETGVFDESAAEIPAYDPATSRVFVTNSFSNTIDILDISDPANPTLFDSIDLAQYGAGPNSVAFANGLGAVAVEADPAQEPGVVVFFDAAGTVVDVVTVGALPDGLAFTPDGTKVVVANEGEPNDDYTVDPEGTISVIDVSGPVRGGFSVTTLDFTAFNGNIDPLVRIYGPEATVAQDLEPEYVATAPDSSTAYVTLQENNAVAVVDLSTPEITAVVGIGFKDHSVTANALDASDRDGQTRDTINITTWPVFGMYQPDAIGIYAVGGSNYLVTANEGDSRDYDGYSEEERVKDLILDATSFPNSATLQLDENLGRLTVTTANGDTDNDGAYEELYANGARSFTIWDASGNLVWDSGDQLEQITASLLPTEFNSDNDENGSFDSRSDAKGPEPEALVLGAIAGRDYAFIGLERIGGVMVFDITDPNNPLFVTYDNNRDFSGDAEAGTAGDLGPEGLVFVEPGNSPNGEFLLIVANEVSGSTAVYQIDATAPTDVALSGFGGDTTAAWLLAPLGMVLLLGLFLAVVVRRRWGRL